MQSGDSKVIISIVDSRRNHYLLKHKHWNSIQIDIGKFTVNGNVDRDEKEKHKHNVDFYFFFIYLCVYDSCFLYSNVFE